VSELTLESGGARVTIDVDRGGRLASLNIDGLELLVGAADDAMAWGCYVMAPFAGRLRQGRFRFNGDEHQLPRNMAPHAIHGTVYDRPWRIEEVDRAEALLTCDLGPDWPFPGRVAHSVRLTDGGLELRLEVGAEHEPFPASCGWHPWWRRRLARGGPLELAVDAQSMWLRDADGVPTGELVSPPPPGPYDDCMTDLQAPPVLRWDGALELTVESSCDDLVVFDLPTHAICVEPQTGPPDALRLTPVVVEPGWPLVAEATFTWDRL
jgi:aldose 1-epimerase